MSLTLVVMAAGLGSRFGGTKQLAEVGPDGEAFLDFSIADAVTAGVDRVVLVVRSDIEADVRRHVARRHDGLDIGFVCQDEHGPSRPKPWGTAHAVLTAAPEVDGPFLVCNADDYYGRSTYAAVASRAVGLAVDEALLAGFRLDRTLPRTGTVSRGICTVVGQRLSGLVETHGIGWQADGSIRGTDPEGVLPGDAVASMNFWAFPKAFFAELESAFTSFLADHGDDEKAEFLLPLVVHDLMAARRMRVAVVPTEEAWVGVTNPDDLLIARARIADLRQGP